MVWILASVGYVFVVGSMGVTSKVALRTVDWKGLFVWAGIIYGLIAVALVTVGGTRISWTFHGWMAALSALLAAAGLMLFFVAVSAGDVSRVVPLMSVYPVVTVSLGAWLLSEEISATRAIGIALVLVGVVLVTR